MRRAASAPRAVQATLDSTQAEKAAQRRRRTGYGQRTREAARLAGVSVAERVRRAVARYILTGPATLRVRPIAGRLVEQAVDRGGEDVAIHAAYSVRTAGRSAPPGARQVRAAHWYLTVPLISTATPPIDCWSPPPAFTRDLVDRRAAHPGVQSVPDAVTSAKTLRRNRGSLVTPSRHSARRPRVLGIDAMQPRPDDVARLFWEIDPSTLDLEAHNDYVIERVMSRGGWESMRWLRRTYSVDVLRDFLVRRGQRLRPRELAYWALMTDLPIVSSTGGGRPPWAGE